MLLKMNNKNIIEEYYGMLLNLFFFLKGGV
jgi:hypothetical protein